MFDFLKKLFRLNRGSDAKAVGDALQVQLGPGSDVLTNTIAAVDRVHLDGVLPALPIKRAMLSGAHGVFRCDRSLCAIDIIIHSSSRHPDLTTAHEIGHFLDLKGIDDPNSFASESSPLLDKWRAAVVSSDAIRQIARLSQSPHGKFAETLPGGNVVEYEVDRAYAEYLLDSKEVWARSYAQYIAVKAGNRAMCLQLDRLRNRPAHGLYYAEQWDSRDFPPIMLAMDDLFRGLGWIKT